MVGRTENVSNTDMARVNWLTIVSYKALQSKQFTAASQHPTFLRFSKVPHNDTQFDPNL
jgi:hypothetical protein